MASSIFYFMDLYLYCVALIGWDCSVVCANDIVRDIQAGQRHLPCQNLLLHVELLTCEVITDDDAIKIYPFMQSRCYRTEITCENGEIKTCHPVMKPNTLIYKCLCRSILSANREVANSNMAPWQYLSVPVRGFLYRRQTVQKDGTEVSEYTKKPQRFIISHYNLHDSLFTASSYYGGSSFRPHRARLDNYYNYGCCWSSKYVVRGQWLQMDLPYRYVIRGVIVMKRCDVTYQYTKEITVKRSDDDIDWQDVMKNEGIQSAYMSSSVTVAATVWLPEPASGRYWRIYITRYNNWPSMKCDLIGYPL